MKFLNVDNICRCFIMFIGSIKRQPVNNPGNMFMTLDTIGVYKRDPTIPLGESMPYKETFILLTTWNSEGMPIQFVDLNEKQNILDFWKNRLHKNCSFIHCLPVWEKKVEYEFSVGNFDKTVGYAKEPFNYSRFVPKKEESDSFDEIFEYEYE